MSPQGVKKQSPLQVAIQGVRASFHDGVAQRYFSGQPFEPIECPSFKDLCHQLQTGRADFAVMAIENSIAGSILPNYSLLEQYGFKIIGEVYQRIELNLMALPGQTLQDIQWVQSHPMALLQCQEFLNEHPQMKVIESADTAESAKNIAEHQLQGQAALAGALAAKVYGLEVLRSGVESNSKNYTRFLILTRESAPDLLANKTSVRFEVHHRPGSLAQVLSILSQNQINMTKIQSVPILGRPYQYSFHVDLEWENRKNYESAIQQVHGCVENWIHFGDYKKGERPSL